MTQQDYAALAQNLKSRFAKAADGDAIGRALDFAISVGERNGNPDPAMRTIALLQEYVTPLEAHVVHAALLLAKPYYLAQQTEKDARSEAVWRACLNTGSTGMLDSTMDADTVNLMLALHIPKIENMNALLAGQEHVFVTFVSQQVTQFKINSALLAQLPAAQGLVAAFVAQGQALVATAAEKYPYVYGTTKAGNTPKI